MAVVARSTVSHDGYVIEGHESGIPSTSVSGNVVGQSMYNRVTLSDGSGTTIGNTANWTHTYGAMNQAATATDANSYYLEDEAGNLFRLEAIYGGGGNYTNAETSPSSATGVHTEAFVLQPVDDNGVNISGAPTLTTYVPAGAYGSAAYINDDLVDHIEITSMNGPNTASGNLKTTNPDGDPLIVCFTRGTLIRALVEGVETDVPIEDLSVGMEVMTLDKGAQKICWIRGFTVSEKSLRQNPDLRPIRIRAGALGGGLPEQELLLSPQHRVLCNAKPVKRMFDKPEVLVAAKHLTVLPGIDIAEDVENVEYFHFLLSAHEVVYSNGAPTETLYCGLEALRSIPKETRKEIFSLFPELKELVPETIALPLSARELVGGRRSRQLAQRLEKNAHTVQTALSA